MNLEEFFKENSRVAIAFSGGVDSAYLLYMAKKAGINVKAYYVKSAFQPMFELEDAKRLASELGANMRIIELDILGFSDVVKNSDKRCYFCKKKIFGEIIKAATKDGYTTILDGTNASDEAGDRPGMKALSELKVKSPLRDCSLTKEEIRRLSKKAGLFTWDKPAYACLATRIKPNEAITANALEKVEKAEAYMASLGFSAHRVRVSIDNATVLVSSEQAAMLNAQKELISKELSSIFNKIEYGIR